MHLHQAFKQLSSIALIGLAAGLASAFFLVSLDRVTRIHWEHPWLLFLLPAAGALSGFIYSLWGKQAEGGTALIRDAIREPVLRVPGRMALLVLPGTLITHLCGGSAGREGTAVQMGGSLAAVIGRCLRVPTEQLPLMLRCGMAAGFGAVFGTPVAGAIFALEVSGPGRLGLPLRSLLFCLLAAVIADRTVAAWNIEHTAYVLASVPQTVRIGSVAEILLLTKTAAAAIAFGMAARLFIQMTDAVRSLLKRLRVPAWLRPAIGGTAVLVLTFLVGDRSYLGLGVTANPISPGGVSIQTSFAEGGAGWLSWWWKLAFTALTVGSGFKGGEVTPLFFIGAALGNMLSGVLGLPVSYLAALGFTAVFAAAARTPLACTIMAVELFAPANPGLFSTNFLVAVALCAFLAARSSGRHSLYGDVAAGE